MTDTSPQYVPLAELIAEAVAPDSPVPDLYEYPDDIIPADLIDQPDDAPADRPWRIDDDGAAEWALRKYAAAAREVAHLEAQAAEWRAQIDAKIAAWRGKVDAWLAHRSTDPKATMARFEALLIDYAQRRREADPKAKATLTLPSGAVPSRNVKSAPRVVDADAFTAWALASGHAELVRTKHEPKMDEVKKTLMLCDVVIGHRCSVCAAVDTSEDFTEPANIPVLCSDLGAHQWERITEAVYLTPEGERSVGVEVVPEHTDFGPIRPS